MVPTRELCSDKKKDWAQPKGGKMPANETLQEPRRKNASKRNHCENQRGKMQANETLQEPQQQQQQQTTTANR
jgi:hypothetical protein